MRGFSDSSRALALQVQPLLLKKAVFLRSFSLSSYSLSKFVPGVGCLFRVNRFGFPRKKPLLYFQSSAFRGEGGHFLKPIKV